MSSGRGSMSGGNQAVTLRYEPPAVVDRPKIVRLLHRRPEMICAVQIVTHGGETNLHSHPHLDGFWFVLAGRARFYGHGDRVIGELGRYEGIVIPSGCQYWFESVGEEPVELLQVEAWDRAGPAEERHDVAAMTASTIRAMSEAETPEPP